MRKKISSMVITLLRRVLSRRFVGSCALLGLVFQFASGGTLAGGPLDKKIDFNISADTSLEAALIEWGSVTGVTVMINTSTLDNQRSKGVKGILTARNALFALLRDSGLSYTEDGGRVLVVPIATRVRSTLRTEQSQSTLMNLSSDAEVSSQNGGILEDETSAPNDARRNELDEVVVTAEKREERLLDVPVPMTVLSASSLVDSNELRLQDYYSSVPGLAFIAGASPASSQTIAIRGITTGAGTNPTVGITIDDVPYGSATNLGGGNTIPNIDPSDLARIEVLRGPQGTLYGASSLGGLIKYVTVDPSTDAVAGHLEAGTSGVYNGAELGYNFRGSINVPLSNTLAILASGFSRRDPGYIDNPVLGLDGVNEERDEGGRLSMLWEPSKELSLKLNALYQRYDGDGATESVSGLGAFQQNSVRGTGVFSGSTQAYSATVTAKLGGVNVVALSGYGVQIADALEDFSAAVGPLASKLYGFSGVGLGFNNKTERATQEIRLSSSIGPRFDWLLGGFYTHEYSPYDQDAPIIDPASGTVQAIGYQSLAPSVYQEYAAFANLTFHVTDQIDVQVGGRQSDIKQVFEASSTLEPLFTGGSTVPLLGTRAEASANPFTYLLTPRFKLSPDLMVYARAASGYRVGGPNGAACTAGNFQCAYDPDKTRDYDIGVKGSVLGNQVSFDASIYYIDWKDIQLSVTSPSLFSYNTNAGAAKSEGVELSLEGRPVSGLTVGAWVTWDDAELTEQFPTGAAYGAVGDRLPYSSRFSGGASFDEEFPIASHVNGFAAGDLSYIGTRAGDFTSTAQLSRDRFPPYAKTDLRAGVRWESWTANMFLNNVTNRRGSLNGNPATDTVVYIQPRLIGVNLKWTF